MEQEIQNPIEQIEEKKSNKLTVILVFLILVSGAVLGYLVYKSNAESTDLSKDTNLERSDVTFPSKPIDDSMPVNELNTPETPYTTLQVSEKNTKSSCWTIIEGAVYDITSYIPNHPGGEAEIVQICGKDGTQLFAKPTEHKEGGASNVLTDFKVGRLVTNN